MHHATVKVVKTYIDGQYGQIHCRLARPQNESKPAVVCLHMSPKSGRLFADVLPFLARNRAAIAPDYPGHGESDPPPAKPHVSIADFAKAIWRAVDSLTQAPVHFVGMHTGAMVAVEATRQRPADVHSIVSLSAPLLTDEEAASLLTEYAPIPLDEQGTRFRVGWSRVLEHRGPGMTMQMAATSFAENLRAGDDYEWGHRAAFNYARAYRQHFAELQTPVLVVNPADDCFELSKRADALLKVGRRIDCEQWGHGFLSAYPADAADLILDFIEEHDPGC